MSRRVSRRGCIGVATLLAAAIWVGFAAGGLRAQQPPVTGAEQWLRNEVRQAVQTQLATQRSFGRGDGVTFDLIQPQIASVFARSFDSDGNGIADAADLDLRLLLDKARRRAQFLQSKFQLDLDGDGRITKAELFDALRPRLPLSAPGQPAPAPEANNRRLEDMAAAEMKLDTNGDGAVTYDELATDFERMDQQWQLSGNPNTRLHEFIMTLDAGNDGGVTLEELESAWRRMFAELDTNGDGKGVAAEIGLQTDIALPPGRPAVPPCVIPKRPAANDKLVLAGAYEGRGLSTVRLGTNETETTTVADLVIEPGTDPLFVVLTSYRPNIWRFSGAVERVSAAVTLSKNGVTGLPRNRVHFATGNVDCLPMFYEPEKHAAATAQITTRFGRAPDVVAGAYGVTTLRLPSGIEDRGSRMRGEAMAPDNADALRVWREMLRFNPAGLIELDPEQVISATDVKRYTVVPSQAGLAQLVAEGALALEPGGIGPMMTFVVKRATRFPAGLHGAHSVTFIVEKGVPVPDGDPGHSCVFFEETGKSVGRNTPHCAGRAPKRLADLSRPPALPTPPPSPQIIRDCISSKAAPIQLCPQISASQRLGMPLTGKPMPGNLQRADTQSGDKRMLLPDDTLIADMAYVGRHGIVLALARKPERDDAPNRLRLVQITLDGTVHAIAAPEFEEAYSTRPEGGDGLLVFARTGETFTRHTLNLATHQVSETIAATREQADAIGHRKDPPIGRGDRLIPGKTFPGYGGQELEASCMGLIGCLRQFLENDTDGDGRRSPADRKRLAYSTFDGKRNMLLPYEVDEVLGKVPYLEGLEIFVRTGTEIKAVLFDINALAVVSERPATAAESVSGPRR